MQWIFTFVLDKDDPGKQMPTLRVCADPAVRLQLPGNLAFQSTANGTSVSGQLTNENSRHSARRVIRQVASDPMSRSMTVWKRRATYKEGFLGVR